MNGHALGERLAWVLAAALLAFGSASASAAPATASPASAAHVSDAGSAAVDGSSIVDPSLLDEAAATTTSRFSGAAAALAADRFGLGALSQAGTSTTPRAAAAPKAAAPKPAAPKAAAPKVTAPKPASPWWTAYHGKNHVWMPTLGINRAVYLFACSRSTDPDNLVYRWGCAGTNNVYLLGHAYGVFKALHDAYSNGRLKVGMPVIYADGSGHVHLYRVTEWRIVSPADAGWAIAAQSRPSMTLQTCIGPNDSERLNVRLVQVNA